MKFFSNYIDLNTLNYEQFKEVLIDFVEYGSVLSGVKDIEAIKSYISSKLTAEEKNKLLTFITAGKISYDGLFREIRLCVAVCEHLPEAGFVGIQSALSSLLLHSRGPVRAILPAALSSGLIGITGTLAFLGVVSEIRSSMSLSRLNEIKEFMLLSNRIEMTNR